MASAISTPLSRRWTTSIIASAPWCSTRAGSRRNRARACFSSALQKPLFAASASRRAFPADAAEADLDHSRLARGASGSCPDLAGRIGSGGACRRPPGAISDLIDILEESPPDAPWRAPAATERLLELMAPAHREKIRGDPGQRPARASAPSIAAPAPTRTAARPAGRSAVRRHGRLPAHAGRRQFAPDAAGSRWRIDPLAPAVAARGGAADGPAGQLSLAGKARAKAYKLCGDGLCVPVIRHLAEHLLQPLLRAALPGNWRRRNEASASTRQVE